jgi:hypothetical protein
LEKSKDWDSTETENDQLVQRLEAELYADDLGGTVNALEMEDFEPLAPVKAAAAEPVEVLDSDDNNTDTDLHVS